MERYRYAAVGPEQLPGGVMVLATSAGGLIWDAIPCRPLAHNGTISNRWRGESLLSLAPHSNNKILLGDSLQAEGHANSLLTEAIRGVGAMKALQTTCIVGLMASMGFYLAGGNRPVATVPDAMPGRPFRERPNDRI